jgi:hypothetical protein
MFIVNFINLKIFWSCTKRFGVNLFVVPLLILCASMLKLYTIVGRYFTKSRIRSFDIIIYRPLELKKIQWSLITKFQGSQIMEVRTV